jgi:hypothetical protein
MPESRDALSLAAALRVMGPLVEMLLREGVTYPQLVTALKQTYPGYGADSFGIQQRKGQ